MPLAAFALALLSSTALAQTATPPADSQRPQPGGANNEDIVVTAQRREENVSRVPISIATYSQAQMDRQGIRKIDDISRLTPALNFTSTSGVNANNSANIAIRGIASDVGSATTAIYIDDTPIQIRNIGYLGGNPYPRVFDLDRVEVLRGPQGTLFGAGAEGGAVRFITTQPRFDDTHVYARGELAGTDHGAASYEGGVAVGAPLGEKIAFRASAWYRRDGGYVDKATPGTNTVIDKDINSQNTYSAKFAVTVKLTEDFTLTPAVFFQNVRTRSTDQFWEGYGNISDNNYISGVNNYEPTHDRFVLPSLKAQLDMGNVSLVSNTSYFDRKESQRFSYTTYQSFLRTGNPFGVFRNKDPNNSDAFLNTRQKNFIEELRLLSVDNKLVDWTAGLFYSRTKQGFSNFTEAGVAPGSLSSAGLPLLQGRYSYFEETFANDKQYAGYANVDIKPLDGLKVSLSARYTHNVFDFEDTTDGPVVGNFRDTVNSSAKENSFTPKATVTYQATPTNMVYATASKGFRPGGAQPLVSPDFCARDLALLGLTRSPTSYASDTLWNYEAGTKNRFMDNRLTLDASVYHIKWKNIQQSINLPFCNLNYIGNLGTANGNGAELSVSANLIEGLQVGANVAYTQIKYAQSQFIGPNRVVADGQRFGGPKWSGSMFGQFDRPLNDRVTAYGRVDYSFASDKSPPDIPGNFGYDSGRYALPNTNFVSVRAGARFSGFDVSLFVDNLTNSNDVISRNHDGLGGPLYYLQSFRPRTIGLTTQLRY